jgi:hypothetical protein
VLLPDAIGRVRQQSVLQIVENHPKWKRLCRRYNGFTVTRYGDVDRDMGNYMA